MWSCISIFSRFWFPVSADSKAGDKRVGSFPPSAVCIEMLEDLATSCLISSDWIGFMLNRADSHGAVSVKELEGFGTDRLKAICASLFNMGLAPFREVRRFVISTPSIVFAASLEWLRF